GVVRASSTTGGSGQDPRHGVEAATVAGHRQFPLVVFALLALAPAAHAHDVPLNALGTTAGHAQHRGDGTILFRPGATLHTAVPRPCQPSVLLSSLNVLERLPLNAAMTTAHFGADPFYQPLFLQRFDGLTPENELKWENTEPQEGTFTFEAGDRIVNWALANG